MSKVTKYQQSNRTPETEYFKQGFYKYKKVKGKLIKQTWQYSEDGMNLALLEKGSVKT